MITRRIVLSSSRRPAVPSMGISRSVLSPSSGGQKDTDGTDLGESNDIRPGMRRLNKFHANIP